jgi:3-hydroxyethyl bacteriochlorophyllide a dehydrogenase
MDAMAVILEQPERLKVDRLELTPPGDGDVVVDVAYSGISTGTERLLWSGRMPPFPGLGYPLVPGYESVGQVTDPGRSEFREGDWVFVPGARCFGEVRGLFGGSASRLVVDASRLTKIDPELKEKGALLALAATAAHALVDQELPDLIVGHGVLGRLLARITVALGGQPLVWETNPIRSEGTMGYQVVHPSSDEKRDYRSICDVSGDPKLLDDLIGRLGKGGEVVLAGFYSERLSFDFPPAFIKEARIRIAAEWQPADMAVVQELLADGRLSLNGLISHCWPVERAEEAYRTAFQDPACLKMLLEWKERK